MLRKCGRVSSSSSVCRREVGLRGEGHGKLQRGDLCVSKWRGGHPEQGPLQEQRGRGGLKPPPYDEGNSKALESSPTDLGGICC